MPDARNPQHIQLAKGANLKSTWNWVFVDEDGTTEGSAEAVDARDALSRLFTSEAGMALAAKHRITPAILRLAPANAQPWFQLRDGDWEVRLQLATPGESAIARFLSDLAVVLNCAEDELIDAGYTSSIPAYICGGKTVHQVAGAILSARRRAKRLPPPAERESNV